jgi:uncharacterized repeat protein (TIGR01451 family)
MPRRLLRYVLATVVLVAAAFPIASAGSAPAGLETDPDGSRSRITQDLVDREPLPGGGWQLTIEATLDSNAVCHVLLFQCVVDPELAPANLTLQSVECLSPGWQHIQITLPVAGTVVDVCARFDAERAGRDQKFRFTYTTPINVGTVSETVRFFRFPEEFLFIRAQDTIEIDLAAQADVLDECPDSAAIGSAISCTVSVEALSNVPDATVTRTPPAQFANATLVPDVNPGDWDCSAVTSCSYVAGGGTLGPGAYTFTAAADVTGPPGDVEDCAGVASAGTTIASDCDEVRVYDPDTTTVVDIEKTAPVTEVDAGSPLAFTVTVSNTGPNPAQDVRVFETPPPLLENATIELVGGDGDWSCAAGATLDCTTATLAANASATFEVRGTVSPSAPDGSEILNEVTATYANDPFGPDFPVRDGTLVLVRGATEPVPVRATVRFTG